jgi:hypothetical protein
MKHAPKGLKNHEPSESGEVASSVLMTDFAEECTQSIYLMPSKSQQGTFRANTHWQMSTDTVKWGHEIPRDAAIDM